MKFHRGLLAACLMSLAEIGASGQTGNSLSLSQAVGIALESQPLMRSAQLGVNLADQRIAEARAGRMPAVRITETMTRGNNPVFVFGSLLEQARFGPQNLSLPALNNPQSITNLRTAISASVPAFDGMKTSARIAQSSIVRDQAVLQMRFAEQRVRFEIIRDYFGVLVAKAGRQVTDEAVRTAESDVKRARDRLDAGLGVQSEMLAAEVQLAEFKQQQIQSEGNVATASVILNVAIGSAPQAQYSLTGELLRKRFIVAGQEELVHRAMINRSDYAQANSAIQLTERRVSERRGDYLPELNLFGSFGSSSPNVTSGSTDYSVGAGLTFNLFDAARASRLSQAHIEQNLAHTERDRLADQILVEVARAYHEYRAAEQQLEVAEATLSQAAEALRIIQDRYEAGLTNITDVLRAETALLRAKMNVVGSRHGHYVSYANVLMASGELNDVSAFEP
jgi:outer membrane protein TolC